MIRLESKGKVMAETSISIKGKKKSTFKDKVKDLIPGGGNLDLCLTCGACASGCPASGLEDMDPRKFLRMCAMGLDEEVTTTPWVWMLHHVPALHLRVSHAD